MSSSGYLSTPSLPSPVPSPRLSPLPSPRSRTWSVGSLSDREDRENLVRVKRVLVTVEPGGAESEAVVPLIRCLHAYGCELIAMAGSMPLVKEAHCEAIEAADYAGEENPGDPAVLLHPRLLGGVECERAVTPVTVDGDFCPRVDKIDAVIMLVPAQHELGCGEGQTTIGNEEVQMLRTAASSFKHTLVCSRPGHYQLLIEDLAANKGCSSLDQRVRLAAMAFQLTATLDRSIAAQTAHDLGGLPPVIMRHLHLEVPFKYGVNPHQRGAGLYSMEGHPLPIKVLNGFPGYNNMLDAASGWKLVRDIRLSLNTPVVASIKCRAPVGVALPTPLTALEQEAFGLPDETAAALTPIALACVRARNTCPVSSLGDLMAASHEVDVAMAEVLMHDPTVGVVASGYSPEALALLKGKRGGKYVVLQADMRVNPPELEFRELTGAALAKRATTTSISAEKLANESIPESAQRDLALASVISQHCPPCCIVMAREGQVLGIGSGQQRQKHAMEISGRKLRTYQLRQLPKVRALKFRPRVQLCDRINAQVRYIEGDQSTAEMEAWAEFFEQTPEPLTEDEVKEGLSACEGISMACSEAIPLGECCELMASLGVRYVCMMEAEDGEEGSGLSSQEGALQAAQPFIITRLRQGAH
ncbi:unnamed protein product [Chrysoparadoxa australica]